MHQPVLFLNQIHLSSVPGVALGCPKDKPKVMFRKYQSIIIKLTKAEDEKPTKDRIIPIFSKVVFAMRLVLY